MPKNQAAGSWISEMNRKTADMLFKGTINRAKYDAMIKENKKTYEARLKAEIAREHTFTIFVGLVAAYRLAFKRGAPGEFHSIKEALVEAVKLHYPDPDYDGKYRSNVLRQLTIQNKRDGK